MNKHDYRNRKQIQSIGIAVKALSCRLSDRLFQIGVFAFFLLAVTLALRSNVYASAYFMGNYEICRPGETVEVDVNITIPAGDTYYYESSDPSIFIVDHYTRKSYAYRVLTLKGVRRGIAKVYVRSRKSGIIAEMTIQVANYKQYFGVCSKYSSKNPIKKITISGKKLTINGKPMLITQSGSKQLKKKKYSFKLTKNTFYGSADAGIYVSQGAAAKKAAKKTWQAPMLHVYVEGKKVLAYFGSS